MGASLALLQRKKVLKIYNFVVGGTNFSAFFPCMLDPFNLPEKAHFCMHSLLSVSQRYTCRVLQTIHMKLILLCVWAERAVLDSAKTA